MKKFCNEHAVLALASLVVVGMVVQLGVIVYVKVTDYQGEKRDVTNLRNRCELNKIDRGANARGWRTAQTARMNSVAEDLDISLDKVKQLVKNQPKSLPSDSFDLVAAKEYDKIAAGLEQRSRISCAKAFPKAKLFG